MSIVSFFITWFILFMITVWFMSLIVTKVSDWLYKQNVSPKEETVVMLLTTILASVLIGLFHVFIVLRVLGYIFAPDSMSL